MRDVTELVTYLRKTAESGDRVIYPPSYLLKLGWSEEEIKEAQRRALQETKTKSLPKPMLFLIPLAVILLVGLFIRVANADDDICPEVMSWISSHGINGSPICVVSGDDNLTLINETPQTDQNHPNITVQLPSNISMGSVEINLTQKTNTSSEKQMPLNESNATLTEVQSIVARQPILSIYAGENYTVYVQDNKQSSAWFRWLIRHVASE